MKKTIILLFAATMLAACGNNSQKANPETTNAEKASIDSTFVLKSDAGKACNIEFGGIKFTRALNGADSLVTIEKDGRLRFDAGEKKDFFCDPDGILTNITAPILLTEVDNTKPFTLTSKVITGFTKTGLYNAGVLYIYANDTFWQKFCFEQDERGNHRIVSVRTMGTSDDNNHDIVKQDFVYMRIYSNIHTVAFYYSLDNKDWQVVRLYKNNYPEKVFVGISNQCPRDKGSFSHFEGLSLSTESLSDIRMGK